MVSPYASSAFSSLGATKDYRIDALLGGTKWGGGRGTGATVTYSFANAASVWKAGYGSDEPSGPNIHALDPAGQAAFKAALAAWSEVANITFTNVAETPSSVGDIRVAYSGALSAGAYAWAYYPGGYAEAGDVWLNANYAWSFGAGSYSQLALMHELGHALGLKHSFEGARHLNGAEDSRRYTVMSYTGYSGAAGEPITPMLYDILAIQAIYGTNKTTHIGDTTYAFAAGPVAAQCIWDAGGTDTIDCSAQTIGASIDLAAGGFSSIGTRGGGVAASLNVAIAFGAVIENATGGSGDDTLAGNTAANQLLGGIGADRLSGLAGNDTLDGGGGIDVMAGGVGNDTYIVSSTGDQVSEARGQGTDTVLADASFTLPANVEKLILSGSGAIDGTGNALANSLTGNDGANALSGLGGNDTLDGGGGNDTLDGGPGGDRLYGGSGNDTYIVDASGDIVSEFAGQGTDSVFSRISYRLTADVEALTLTGTAAINATGNDLANTILGNGAANRLTGGAGADTLDGGGGDDRFVYTAVSDSRPDSPDVIIAIVGIGASGGDRIDLAAIDAIAGTRHNEAFSFIGTAAFTAAGQLRVSESGTDTLVQANIDSDLAADLVIIVHDAAIHASDYAAVDFIL
ncbi:MAG: M10 family metallopeptidase C-terminal domain-containing protein [Rhodospirillales bacterium]|nr:M10 family metallopeptidase C-terminal domain-containing protein [Rhodospirillales bacterium]